MSGCDRVPGSPRRFEALLTNLARAGWYSAPIHDGWLIASPGRDSAAPMGPELDNRVKHVHLLGNRPAPGGDSQ